MEQAHTFWGLGAAELPRYSRNTAGCKTATVEQTQGWEPMINDWAAAIAVVCGLCAGQAMAQEIAFSSPAEANKAAAARAIVATQQRLPDQIELVDDRPVRPFSRFAFGTRMGTLGWGGQMATPLTSRLNLRGSANFFNFGYGLTVDGANYSSELHLKSGAVSVDYYPWHSSFHISPGFLIFKSTAGANMNVPGGGSFSLGDVDYTSDPSDPIHGTGALKFGRTFMPSLAIGFGNMIPKHDRNHWSVPVDIGVAYTGQNTMSVVVNGSACQQGVCESISDPSNQQNVVQEQSDINASMKRFKIYPILTTGVAYRF